MAIRVNTGIDCRNQVDTYYVSPEKDYVFVHPADNVDPPHAWTANIPTQYAKTTGPKWDFTEHEDGTVTLSPSIFMNPPNGWHGWLQRGEFKVA